LKYSFGWQPRNMLVSNTTILGRVLFCFIWSTNGQNSYKCKAILFNVSKTSVKDFYFYLPGSRSSDRCCKRGG
jgi:hypothetical protein